MMTQIHAHKTTAPRSSGTEDDSGDGGKAI